MGFVLLDRKNELVFSAPIRYVAKSIRGSIIYITLSINTYKTKNLSINISGLWTHCLLLIINELRMTYVKLVASMDKQLYRARSAIAFLTVLFGGLFLVVLIGDFYQFAPINNHIL